MGDDLSVGIKMGITLVIVVAVVSVILTVSSVGNSYSRNFTNRIVEKTNPGFDKDLRMLASVSDKIPAPSIYVALERYGVANLNKFDMKIGSNEFLGYKSEEKMNYLLENSHLQLYFQLTEDKWGFSVALKGDG